MLPQIIRELLPNIIELCKSEIKSSFNAKEDTIKDNVTIKNEVTDFKKTNGTQLDNLLKKRESKYYNYAKYEHLLDLYGECIEEEPVYIPKKFRNDNYEAVSSDEMKIMRKVEYKRFQAECEIFTLRRDRTTEEITDIDEIANRLIDQHTMSEEAKIECRKRWIT